MRIATSRDAKRLCRGTQSRGNRKYVKTPFSGAKKNNKCPSSFRMEISLENKPHHTTILRARQKYSEVGEEVEARARCLDTSGIIGPAAPLQVMVIVIEEQKSSSAKIIITSFWHYPSHCMKFPNVTKQKVKVVFLSTLLTSS